jgi:hypothetical protein
MNAITPITTVTGVSLDGDRIEVAAITLAEADGKDWTYGDVRNRYRGLALVTVRSYLARHEQTDQDTPAAS